MFRKLFKREKDKETDNVINKNNNDILQKLQNKQNVYSKLDFNYEHLNKYLSKCIGSYLSSIYRQDISVSKKYLTDDCLEKTIKEIDETKKLFKYSNEYVNIISAELESQSIQSINYISHITIKVEIAAVYHRENIFTGTVKKIEELYTESIIFEYKDTGWKMAGVLNQNFIKMNDEVIVRM
ncbi:hypothetical protein [Alkaliphilus sp. B6464]|uniref:hypothetical protein n=1 Tax=Alkaliphilus sp. B6464 TaxID=2731219 RepID=UPI001BA5D714|nr:hypothetical protein [Alkaliphilus sp. B6464]QUH21944.1 hypothetical protein HYG84_18735 [Alkaliphilus sp. B6464]